MLAIVGVEILMRKVIWVCGFAVVVGKVVLHEVAAVLLGLVEAVRIWVRVGTVVHHHVLIGLVHWVGEQSLDLEGLLNQNILHIVREIVDLVLYIVHLGVGLVPFHAELKF